MIDIHTHILPGVDDGPADMDTALSTLQHIEVCGVTDLFLTPHFMPGAYQNTKEKIVETYQLFKQKALERGISINLHLGLEIYLTELDNNNNTISDNRLGDSDYVLVETALHGFPINLKEILFSIVRSGLKPILAHPERYIDFIQNVSLAEDYIYRNVYFQGNAGSFLGYHGRTVAGTAWEMFHKGFYHFIASDEHCHGKDYSLIILRNMLMENYSESQIDLLMQDNPARILQNEKVVFFNPEIKPTRDKGNSGNIFQKFLRLLNNE